MDVFFLFVLLALFHPVLPFPTEDPEFLRDCPKFRCGTSDEEIGFPFANNTHNEKCGPFVVEGCEKEEQQKRIQLERGSSKWYQLESINCKYPFNCFVSVIDKELEMQLNSNKNCSFFNESSLLHFQYLEFASMPIQFLNLWKCDQPFDSISGPLSHLNHTDCSEFTVYYADVKTGLPSTPPPHKCSFFRLPLNITSSRHDNIFQRLTAKFFFNVTVHSPCFNCPLGACHYDNAEGFHCIPAKDTNNKLRLALGLGIGCTSAVPIILLLLFIIYRRQHRKGNSSNLLRANTDAFSKSDLEGANTFFGLSIFSYTQLEEATNNFASENELGDGGFGTVYYGKLQDTREVAVKRLYERNYSKVKQFLNEIEILTQLRHPNLVSLYGCTSRRSRELLLVYEYIPNGTVADHLHGEQANSSPLTWPIRMRIAIETASALVYLHARDIIHRDVKTNNILLGSNFHVKVGDFGISRLFPNDVTHISTAPQGTPGYVDPEYYHCYQLTEKSDVYSFGVVLVELISSMPAVDISRDRHEINLANLAINRIQKCAFDELIDPFLGYQSDEEVKRMTTLVAELAFLCLQQDKEMRPTMDDVLEELKRIESGEYESDNLKEEEEHFDS